MAMAASKVSLKLLIDTNTCKVLFAEANKDFVDFLFSLLSLPIGTVIKLLTKESMVGCIGNLHESIQNLSETYLQTNQAKDSILDLKISAAQFPLLLPNETSVAKRFYAICWDCDYRAGVSNQPKMVMCPYCFHMCSSLAKDVVQEAAAKEGSSGEGGYVKGMVTYMVTDDLVVKPMSTLSSIALINKLSVKDLGAIEEKEVDLGIDEGLMLLKASLESNTVFSSIFLGNMEGPNLNMFNVKEVGDLEEMIVDMVINEA